MPQQRSPQAPLVPVRGIYAILNLPDPFALAPVEIATALCRGGAAHLQLRAKGWSTAQRLEVLQVVAPVCKQAGVPLWVNDDLDATLAGIPGVCGVHLGQGDLAVDAAGVVKRLRERGLGFGVSTHSLPDVAQACALAPDYLGFGPIFATHTKVNPEPTTGVALLQSALALASVPVVAIGGIGHDALAMLRATGVASVAMISALTASEPGQIEVKTRVAVREFFGS